MTARCPICQNQEIAPPHGVCLACFEQLKSVEVHTLEQISQAELALLRDFHPEADPEILEGNIASRMAYEHNNWEQMTKKGLSATHLAIIVVDEAEHLTDWEQWHRRRIAFLDDLISQLPDSLFLPVTRPQLNRYARRALAYWDGDLPEAAARETYRAFSKIIGSQPSSLEWDVNTVPLWMFHDQDKFDWVWRQFLGCIYESVSEGNDLSEDQWIDLFWSHFPDALIDWVTGRPPSTHD